MEASLVTVAGRNAEVAARTRNVHYVAILGVALLLRLSMVFSIAKGDPRFWFFNQASEYGCLAQSMLSGHGYASPFCGATGPSAFLAPGYPTLVAAIFHLFGSYSTASATVMIALQMMFCELTVLAAMLLAKRLLGAGSANLAGSLYAISPPALGLPVLFWETSLSMLLLTGVILAAIYCVDHPRKRSWVVFGIYCAAAMFVNPSLLLTFAAVLVWATWQRMSVSLHGPVLTLTLWCAIYSAWPIRNEIQMHAFVPMRTNLGYELWQGNRPGSDGSFDFAFHPNTNSDEYNRYAKLGEVAYMQEKSELAVASIKDNKMRFLRLSFKRFNRFWLNSMDLKLSSTLTLNITFSSLMSVVGLALLVRRNIAFGCLTAIPFVVLPAPYYLTHADFRFRLLLDPLAMVLTAFVIREGAIWLYRVRIEMKGRLQVKELAARV